MKILNKFKNIFKKKDKFTSRVLSREVDSYSDWQMFLVKIKGGSFRLNVQPSISSFEIDTIIAEYGKFMELYTDEIGEACGEDAEISSIKILFGILYAFLVRYKTDILSNKDRVIKEEISGAEMMTFSINLIKLNVFSDIIGAFDEDSTKILFDKFNQILGTASKIGDIKQFAKDMDKNNGITKV